jgi:anti-sigma B factor antagonist
MKAELLIVCQPDISALVIDLTLVDFVDSSGLGALLLAYRQLKDHDIPIVLTGVNDMVKKMLEISQIFDLFEYSDTVDEAINI